MSYKNAICACAVLMNIAQAWAQDEAAGTAATVSGGVNSVTIYGLLDQGMEYVNNVATGKTTTNVFRLGSGTATSYFGLRGSENLGRGLQTIWNLEGGFSVDNGTSSQGGRLFGRQAYVGLDGDYGRLTFGRQYTMRFYAVSIVNPFGTGAQGLTTLDNGIANARADNSIAYRYHLGGFEAGADYSFGRDAVNGNPASVAASNCPGETTPSNQCRAYSVLLKYEGSFWGAASSYERNYGGTSATYGGLTSPKVTDSRFTLGGYVHFNRAKIGVGWIKRDDEGIATPKSNLIWVTGTVFVTPSISIDSMLAQIKYENSPNKALAIVLRSEYLLSKRTLLYVTGEHIKNGGKLAFSASTNTPLAPPPPGGAQVSIIAGIRHLF